MVGLKNRDFACLHQRQLPRGALARDCSSIIYSMKLVNKREPFSDSSKRDLAPISFDEILPVLIPEDFAIIGNLQS